jgi:hypothetical protein
MAYAGITSAMTSGNMTITTSNRNYKNLQENVFALATATDNISYGCAFADMDSADTATSTLTISNGTLAADIVGATDIMYFSGLLVC